MAFYKHLQINGKWLYKYELKEKERELDLVLEVKMSRFKMTAMQTLCLINITPKCEFTHPFLFPTTGTEFTNIINKCI